MVFHACAALTASVILILTIITGRLDYVTQIVLASVVVLQALSLFGWWSGVRGGRVLVFPKGMPPGQIAGILMHRPPRPPAPNGEDIP